MKLCHRYKCIYIYGVRADVYIYMSVYTGMSVCIEHVYMHECIYIYECTSAWVGSSCTWMYIYI